RPRLVWWSEQQREQLVEDPGHFQSRPDHAEDDLDRVRVQRSHCASLGADAGANSVAVDKRADHCAERGYVETAQCYGGVRSADASSVSHSLYFSSSTRIYRTRYSISH